MKKVVVLACFVLGNFSILLFALLFLTIYTTKGTVAQQNSPIVEADLLQPTDALYNISQNASYPSASIEFRDARADLVDNLFSHYGSPMVGLGKEIVLAADRYQIPFGYLPAIGACEGAMGRVIPSDSHNTWGWGIYGGTMTKFPSWQYAIDAVSKGLKEQYFAKGLDTPLKMMPKYTPPSQGTWAICVQKYLDELL